MQTSLPWEIPRRQFTVTSLTESIKRALYAEFTDIWVSGEISGVKLAASGHVYFTLKDGDCQVRSVLYARTARLVRFKPRDGVEVLVRGRIDVYAQKGEYQLIVDALEPRGHGQLQVAFEQLKQKLQQEGLFAQERKRKLPPYPNRIGLVTSPSGAVIRDLLHVLTRRFPGLHIRLYPALVQGEGSIEQVARGIEYFSRTGWAEVVIVARGGGSLEDLWTFNEERVARAIAACAMPVISAIGHETDFTIADFVADLRAPTPSAAAEMVVPTREQLLEQLTALDNRLRHDLRYRLADAQRRCHQVGMDRAGASLHRLIGRRLQRVDDLEQRQRDCVRSALRRRKEILSGWEARLRSQDLRVRLGEAHRRLDAGQNNARVAVRRHLQRAAARLAKADGRLEAVDLRLRLAAARARLDRLNGRLRERLVAQVQGKVSALLPLAAKLEQLSPLRVLERGYAIVHGADGGIVKDAAGVRSGEALRIRVAVGEFGATAE